MAKGKDYFGLGKGVSILLAFFFGPLLGIITRFSEGKIIAGLIRLFGGCLLCWLVDLILMITKGHIWRLINA